MGKQTPQITRFYDSVDAFMKAFSVWHRQKRPSEKHDMEKKIDDMFNTLNMEALNFQELYYAERKHIFFLDKQRCALTTQGKEIHQT